MADISVFLKNNIFKTFFINLQHKEINSLLKKDVFKDILILDVSNKIKIFNSYFVDKIKKKNSYNI